MSTPLPTDSPTTETAAGRRGWRRWRPRGRRAVIGASLVAVLVVAGVAAALLGGGPGRGFSDGGFRDGGPGIGLSAEAGELGGLVDGPGGRGDGPGRGGRGGHEGRGGGGLDRGLGDDTLLAGTVVSTAEGALVVTPDGGAPRTIRTDDRTRVRGTGGTGLGDLAAGERVVVRVDGTGDAATAVAVLTPQARVTGTVTALAVDRATVVGVGGLTVTADVAGLSQQPAVGDLVVLTGTATDATTLKADSIRVLPKSS